MCETCGCGVPHVVPLDVQERILGLNELVAAQNRARFRDSGVLAINLMGSPGSGKTALLEATARMLGGRRRLGALAGDLATDLDAARLAAAGIPSLSVNTGSACHLDAQRVHDALHRFAWHDLDYLFVENVGNLVCPALFDLGQAASVLALSVAEGVDKPLKYPVMFRSVGLVVLTKADLLPHLPGIAVGDVAGALARVMPEPRMLVLSALDGAGMPAWIEWLESARRSFVQDLHPALRAGAGA
jgi:hydrogenase nickel incorporation protein HypB